MDIASTPFFIDILERPPCWQKICKSAASTKPLPTRLLYLQGVSVAPLHLNKPSVIVSLRVAAKRTKRNTSISRGLSILTHTQASNSIHPGGRKPQAFQHVNDLAAELPRFRGSKGGSHQHLPFLTDMRNERKVSCQQAEKLTATKLFPPLAKTVAARAPFKAPFNLISLYGPRLGINTVLWFPNFKNAARAPLFRHCSVRRMKARQFGLC